jgi:hypothetical protein
MSGTGITWTSSSTSVATVDATGRATAVHAGTTTITATDSTGATASTTLTVRDPVVLTVNPAGGGTGTVSSTPAGINCGGARALNVGTSVPFMSARAPEPYWLSGCDTASDDCTVTMNDARSVTASFDLKQFVLAVNRAGLGSAWQRELESRGHQLRHGCSETFTINTVVTLTASQCS